MSILMYITYNIFQEIQKAQDQVHSGPVHLAMEFRI